MSPRAKSLHHKIFESWHSSQDEIYLRETVLLKWSNMHNYVHGEDKLWRI